MRKLSIALLLVTALLVAACGPKPAAPQQGTPAPQQQAQAPSGPVEGGTVNLAMFSPPKGMFHSQLSETLYDTYVNELVHGYLMILDEKLQWRPSVAESVQFSPDNKTITYKLRKDVKFHDGQPLTAKDVAFSFKVMLDPKYKGVRTSTFLPILGAKDYREGKAQDVAGIKVINDYEISFTMNEPSASMLTFLNSYSILPSHLFKDAKIDELDKHPNTAKPVGAGPFKFNEYKTDQYIELVRNENYFLGKPKLEKVIWKIITNQDTQVAQLKTGEIDFAEIRPSDVQVVEGFPNVKQIESPDFGYQYVNINHRHEFLKDVRVRQAIAYAINRQGIVDKLLLKKGGLMNSHMPPVSWAYDAASLNAYPYDAAKAKALLADAGFKPGADGVLEKNGKKFEISLKFPAGNKVREQSAPLIQDNLKEVGIKVNLVGPMDFPTMSDEVNKQFKFDLALIGWSLSTDPDASVIWSKDSSWGKVTGWVNPKNEELLKKGASVLKIEERKPIYVEWAKLLNTELPYVFLYSNTRLYAVNKRVQNFQYDSFRRTTINAHEWWVPKS